MEESRGRSRTRSVSRKRKASVSGNPAARKSVKSRSRSKMRVVKSRSRSFSKKRRGLSSKVIKIAENRLATHDLWGTNKGILWDSNQHKQAMVTNLNSDIQIEYIHYAPTHLASMVAYLRGFFANCQRFATLDATCTLDITSRSKAPQWLELYEFVCIKDLPKDATWTNFQTFYNYGLTNTGGTITADGTDPGHTPFQNPLWCQYFHCVKKHRREFTPLGGGGMQARYKWREKKDVHWDYLRDGQFLQHLAYRNRTKVIIPVIRGPIYHDNITPYTQVDYDYGGYSCVYTWQYKTAFFEEAAHDATFVNTLVKPTGVSPVEIYATNVSASSGTGNIV